MARGMGSCGGVRQFDGSGGGVGKLGNTRMASRRALNKRPRRRKALALKRGAWGP